MAHDVAVHCSVHNRTFRLPHRAAFAPPFGAAVYDGPHADADRAAEHRSGHPFAVGAASSRGAAGAGDTG
eukprot:gene26463-24013_t